MTIDSPLFTIIIPTHNRAKLLPTAIESVLAQKYQNWELIIVDDGSTDDTKLTVGQFSDQRIRYIYQAPQERSVARNRGINEANGRYICFMDDDDYYLDHHLSIFYEFLVKHNFPEWILRTGYYKKDNDQLTPTSLYDPAKDGHPVRWAAFNFCGVWSLCIPASSLKIHRFPPEFRHWQDTHLILRILAETPFHQLEVYSYIYIIHPDMGSQTIYHFPDAEQRIESNVEAIRHLFEHYGELVENELPPYTKNYLISQKYLQHANGGLAAGKLKMSLILFSKSIRANRKAWFLKYYLKFLFKVVFYRFL